MVRRGGILYWVLIFVSTFLSAQDKIIIDFEQPSQCWIVEKGKAEIVEEGAQSQKVLKLISGTVVGFDLSLRPSSSYKLSAWMRTNSGSDNMTLQITGIAQNNIAVSTALANWNRIEKKFNTSDLQEDANLEILFEGAQPQAYGCIDKIIIEWLADYNELSYEGIPKAVQREIKEDLGLKMQSDEKVEWMLDGKLGMFIHWGLYAGPAKGEWYMENYGISPEEYRRLAYPESGDYYFDAKDFNPEEWAKLAKKMGATYMNMTTQHHDGYALFESKYMNAFTSKQTHNRDFIKEYVEACRREGLKVGIYKTLINWRFPGYYDVTGTDCKPNKFGYVTDSSHKENARLMKEELYCQVKELVTNYGKIDQIFWDGGWLGQKGSDASASYFWESGKYMDQQNEWPINSYFQDIEESTGRSLGLMGIVRKYQPDVVTNMRSGWIGDYTNEEGGGMVRGKIRTGVVEKCFSLAPGWGYTTMMEDSLKIMSLNKIKRLFVDCIIRNMCCMINVGPDRHGNIPPLIEDRLTEFGKWVKIIGEAVYGTRGGPWQPVDDQYGFCYKDNIVYIYLLDGYRSGTFFLPPVDDGMKALYAYNVITRQRIKIEQKKNRIVLKETRKQNDDLTVIAVVLNEKVR